MKINAITGPIKAVKNSTIVVGVFDEGLTSDAKTVDNFIDKSITKILQSKEFKTDFGMIKIINNCGMKTVVVGLGKKGEFTLDKIRKASALVAKTIRFERTPNFFITLQNIDIKEPLKIRAQAVTEGIVLGLYKFDKYKKKEPDDVKIENVDLIGDVKEIKMGIETGLIISDSVNYVRDITNEPACFMTPSLIAKEAEKIAKENGLKINVYGKKDLEKMGMGGILCVSSGSSQEPKLIVLEYNSKAKERICIVGKGITFDSGGLDIKPADYMVDMKNDKAGAADILGVMKIVSKLKIPLNVIGIIPATENMPGCSAYKPGDIITAYNKKTIEIVNTDAEGRLILADAISFAEKTYKPSAIIDIATLTGAVIIALGYYVAGIIGTDEKLIKKIYDAGQKSSEKVWQLPLWDEYKDNAKGDLADIRNSTKGGGYGPGAINGGVFLSNFVEKTPFVHIDIAGPAYPVEEKEYMPRGATGYGVRLLMQLLMDW